MCVCAPPFAALITLIALQSYNLSFSFFFFFLFFFRYLHHHARPKESTGRTKARRPYKVLLVLEREAVSRATKRLFYTRLMPDDDEDDDVDGGARVNARNIMILARHVAPGLRVNRRVR